MFSNHIVRGVRLSVAFAPRSVSCRAVMKLTLMVLLALANMPSLSFAQGLKPNTTWQNGRGSGLTITSIDSAGALKGNYVNHASGFQCQNTPYDVSGWVDGEKISFAVRWKNGSRDCQSITSWIGYLSNNRIITDWDLVYIDSVEQRPLVYRGSDFFSPKP